MPTGLRRYQQTGDLHFITFSCVRHRPILGTPEARDTSLRILEQTRLNYDFLIFAYVVMPTHVHLLVSEPKIKTLSVVMQVIKQRFSRTRTEEYVWEPRYHDFNVQSDDKRAEKLHYTHHNPVRAGLVPNPEDYPWSSHLSYTTDHQGPVTLYKPWQPRAPHPFTASP